MSLRSATLFLAVALALSLSTSATGADTPPVNVTLYMESLCPGCQQLFHSQLYPTWQRLNATGILKVDVVPYGNAREHQPSQGARWQFTCQHGANECVGNQLETCAIRLLQQPQRWLPFMHCLEARLASGGGQVVLKAAQDCAGQTNVSFADISQCSLSDQGNAWQHEMAQRTGALNPPHQYVPWVTVNGVHTEKIQDEADSNLLKLVCDTYTGTKPKECGAFHSVQRCSRQ